MLTSSSNYPPPQEVRKLFERDGTVIYIIDNFTTSEECSVMMDIARPYLRRATVNEGGDNQAISSARNAQAANIAPYATGDVVSTVQVLYRLHRARSSLCIPPYRHRNNSLPLLRACHLARNVSSTLPTRTRTITSR